MKIQEERLRVDSLDYLRGYAAFLIMLYHFLSWSEISGFLDLFFGKVGYYGVEIFYILSGYTLTFVYSRRKLITKRGVLDFYIKRVLRIFPLLWLTIFITVVLRRDIPELEILFINLTGIFSVYKIDKYIAIGSWSIGNELFFYAFFPALLLIKNNWYKVTVLFLVFLPFAFFAMNGSVYFEESGFLWEQYINPLNHCLFFYSGVLIYQSKWRMDEYYSKGSIILIILCLIFIPYSLRIEVVSGIQRIFYTSLTIFLTINFVSLNKFQNNTLHTVSKHLGDVSYSLYLLHPLVWGTLGYFMNTFDLPALNNSPGLKIIISSILTIFISTIVYNNVEMRIMKLGKTYF